MNDSDQSAGGNQDSPEQKTSSSYTSSSTRSKDDLLRTSLQEDIVTALVYRNDEHTSKMVRLLDVEWFEDPYRDIVLEALRQRETFHEAPGRTHVDDVFGPVLDDPNHRWHKLYHRILRGMIVIESTLNTEYLLSRLFEFGRRQNIKRTIFEAGTVLSQSHGPEDYAKAEEILGNVKNFRPLEKLPVMSIAQLLVREYPPRVTMLGDLITNQSRVMIVGPKGKGKTRLMLEMAMSIASGKSFLHWKSNGEPKRVLYLDGELGGMQFRDKYLADALRRYQPAPETIFFLHHDDFPDGFPALNTSAGRRLVEWAIDECAPDVIVFDNIHTLLQADDSHGAKTWSQTLPLVRSLTARNIAQIWADHTGHDISRNGETDKKTWQMDSVGLISKTAGTEDTKDKLEITLDFNIKHRHSNPDNWRDFQTVDIKFADNEWSFIPSKDNPKPDKNANSEKSKNGVKEPPERAQAFHQKLLAVLKDIGKTPSDDEWRALGVDPLDYRHRLVVLGKQDWKEACWITGLLGEKTSDRQKTQNQHTMFTRVKDQLVNAGWIGCRELDDDDYLVWTNRY